MAEVKHQSSLPWGSLFIHALILIVYGGIYIASSLLFFPFSGVLVLPQIVACLSRWRTNVAFVDRMDMGLTIMVMEELSYTKMRHRTVVYYVTKWGSRPRPRWKLQSTILPHCIVLAFGVGVPFIIAGGLCHIPLLMATGYTIMLAICTTVNFARPLLSSVYCHAAYCYTEYGRNDVWQDPVVAPHVYYTANK